jgi:hypothetical protein
MAVQSQDMKDDKVLEGLLSQPTRRSFPITGTKIASLLTWFGAVYTTYLSVQALQPGTALVVMVVTAFVVQFVFTVAERPILRGKPGMFTAAVFILDALINAGGVFPTFRNIGKTPTAQMIAAAGTPATVDVWPAILISLVIGGIIAVAPEALWKMKE